MLLYNIVNHLLKEGGSRGMIKGTKGYLYLLKIIISTILFSSAIYFENAQQQRLSILVSVFILYLVIGCIRCFIKSDINFYYLSFLIDIILVYFLEYNSRLLINYFFHSFYIIILLEAAISLSFRKGIAIGVITVLVSLIKYGYLIYYKFNFSNVSQLAFFLMINILILVVAGFAQRNNEEKERKDILYRELLDTHKQLKQYVDEVNRLNVVEERNRIARDIHDTLGHNMTALIMQLQMAEHLIKEDIPRAEELLANAAKTAKNSMTGIREVVETLRGAESPIPSEAIGSMIKEFSEKTGVTIKFQIIEESTTQVTTANLALYRIIQEALTNAIRHGKATEISVSLNYTVDSIGFQVTDNGIGADVVKEGYGLKGIRERVKAFGGTIEFGSINGFYIQGILYSEEKND